MLASDSPAMPLAPKSNIVQVISSTLLLLN